jgi:hypothetical protein
MARALTGAVVGILNTDAAGQLCSMHPPDFSSGLYYLAVAQLVTSSFLSMWGRAIAMRLPLWLDDSIDRPFAYRVLSRWVLQWMHDAVPRMRIAAWLNKSMLSNV